MNKNMLKRCVMIIIILLITISFNTSYARGNQKLIEIAQKLEEWENLPEEEREKQGPTYNSVDLKDSVKRSTYNNLVGGNTPTLEEKYSLLDNLPTGSINIRSQKNTQLCWAFSYAYVLDTTSAMKNKKAYSFSTIYSDYVGTKYFNRKNGDVGNFEMALAISVSGAGPVYEEDMPFDNYYKETGTGTYEISYKNVLDEKLVSRAKIKETYDFPSISKTYGETVKYTKKSGGEYSSEELNSVRTLIKQHIKNNGALFSSMYMSYDETEFYKMFSKSTDNGTIAYCNKNTKLTQNHAITIIGWDDTYSKENFANSEYKPLSDGAYIVINSYGEEVFPYFYISYEDFLIEQYVRGIKDIQVYSEEEKDYDNLYQYDELGQTLYYYDTKDGINNGKQVYTSNVFSRKDKTKKEYITEVGIYVPITEGIEIYIDTENGDMKDYGDVVASYTGDKALEPGYHLIKLGNPIEVTGDKFAVIVKYINNDENGGAAYSLECNLDESGLVSEDTIYSKAKAEEGQSFISSDGNNWSDINGYEIICYSSKKETSVTKTYRNTNACIKAFTTVEEPKILVESVNLNETSTTIEEGETKVLTATVLPENATNKIVNWTSGDSSIVEVNGGVIKGIKAGKTTITVTTEDGNKTASCEVTVKPKTIPVESVNLNETSTTIKEGETKVLTATVMPENATNKIVSWTSGDSSIVEVNGGVIKGIKAGKTTVTVTTEDGGKTASCEVTVEEGAPKTKEVTGVNLNKATITVKEGETKVLTATVLPEDATNKTVNWETGDSSIVEVNGGVIKGIKAGKTTVTVTTEDGGKTASCEVTVEAKIISVESVNLNETSTTIEEGETKVLTATVLPENATNKIVSWTSGDSSIVEVNGGVIKGKKVGKTTVTVTTEDGEKTASCEVTVKPKTIPVKSVNLNETSTTIKEGETKVLTATVLPENATNKKVNWSSTDESVVIVENGVIEGKRAGRATVTVTTEDGEKTASCEVIVEAKTIPVETVELDKRSITIEIGTTEVLTATVKPTNATNKKVNWSSEDESIVTVTGGVIEGKKAGKTTVTVTTEDGGKTASCEVTVEEGTPEEQKVIGVNLNKATTTIKEGETEVLIATVLPENATNKKVKWSSTDESVVIVENGVIEGKRAGRATVTVTTEDGEKTASCEVIVEAKTIPVETVELDKRSITIEIGTTEVLTATVKPTNATNKKVNWSSEDESIVTVTGGVIEGKKVGKTTVTVTTEDGEKIATCEVIVRERETENILVETISLNTNKEIIENGTILNLIVTFNPSNATNKNVRWESSNEKVATVNSNGVVKAVGEGKTTIKVISEDGNKEATCEIIVTKKVNNDDDIYSDQKDNTTSDRNLPNTGIKIIFILTLISLSLLATIKFIKYRNLREIK